MRSTSSHSRVKNLIILEYLMVERRDTGPKSMTIISIESCFNAEKLYAESSVLTIGWGRLISDIHVYTQSIIE